MPNAVGRVRCSARLWRMVATGTVAVGHARARRGVREVVRVAQCRMAQVRGPGKAGIDGRGHVLCVLCGASVPFMAWSGGEDACGFGACSDGFWSTSAPR